MFLIYIGKTTGTAGVEPAIYRLEGGGIIHYATCPSREVEISLSISLTVLPLVVCVSGLPSTRLL